MKLSYNIDNIDHKVILCKNKEAYDIKKQLKRILLSKQVKELICSAVQHYAETSHTQVDDALARALRAALFPPTNG